MGASRQGLSGMPRFICKSAGIVTLSVMIRSLFLGYDSQRQNFSTHGRSSISQAQALRG